MPSSTGSARTTITNRELEPLMARRRASEAAYEKHRRQLGLPSLEESRRRAAADLTALTNDLRATRAAEEESESRWRERAFALRAEMAAVDAELQYVRVQIDQPAYPYVSTVAFATTVAPVAIGPFGQFSRAGAFGHRGDFSRGPQRAGIFVGPSVATGRGQVLPSPFRAQRANRFSGAVSPFTAVPFFGWGQSNDSYERSMMINRFNELSSRRAALNARWREFEDEARRAGVPPGWLRK
jgi:hypothetical protein